MARQVPRLAGLVRFPAGWRVQAAIRQRASWLAYPSNCFGTSGNIIKQGMFSNPSESIPCFFIFWLVFENNSDCSASRGTRRATAVYNLQGSLPRPASREACRRAAVKPRPIRMSPYAPARYSRAEMGAGHRPARPASREACRRAAVKPRPTRMSPYAPARQSRAEMGAGHQPC